MIMKRFRSKEDTADMMLQINAELVLRNDSLSDEISALKAEIDSLKTVSSISPDESKGWTEYGKRLVLNKLELPIEKVCAAYPTKMANLHWAISELREAFNEANS
jgi:FtsZ-binding cell division protein ZapB